MAQDYDLFGSFQDSPKWKLNKEHYDKIIAEKGNRKLVYESVLEPFTGDAYLVKAGQIIRLEQREETIQIADWLFITPDLKEHSSMGQSFATQGFFLELYFRVYSNTGATRPLATMVADEVPEDFCPPGYRPHWWIFHCSPEWYLSLDEKVPAGQNSCHMNFVHGLNRIPAIHDIKDEKYRKEFVNLLANNHNFQTFQPCDFYKKEDGQMHKRLAQGNPIPKGTGVEFYAETDVYVVLSSCPIGDQSRPPWGGELPPTNVPQYISVWETGIKPVDPPKWKDWEGAFYDMVAKGEKDISPRTSPDSYK